MTPKARHSRTPDHGPSQDDAPAVELGPGVRTLVGDCLRTLRALRSGSVHCIATSPPYWGLRDYAIAPTDWPEVTYRPAWDLPEITVPAQRCCLGLESDLSAFVGHMVLVFRELARVLRADGCAWVNFGDSFATGTNRGRKPSRERAEDHTPATSPHARKPASWTNRCQSERRSPGELPAKNLLMQPHRVALALQADGWIVRQDNIWSKPSPLPESVTDRTTRAHEYVFQLVRAQRYFFDAFAVSEPCAAPHANTEGDRARAFSRKRATVVAPYQAAVSASRNRARREDGSRGRRDHRGSSVPWAGTRRNLRSVWSIAARPFRGAHFATFPVELPRRCILASTSEVGCCPTCGAPWRRLMARASAQSSTEEPERTETETVGWELRCRCPLARPAPCVVLDPFGGSGTTAEAALDTGREALLCELNSGYVDLQRERLDRWASKRAEQERLESRAQRSSETRPGAPEPSYDKQLPLPFGDAADAARRRSA